MTVLMLWKMISTLFYIYGLGVDYRHLGIYYLTENSENFFFLDGKTVILLYSLGERLIINFLI